MGLDCTGVSGLHVHPSPEGTQKVAQNNIFLAGFEAWAQDGRSCRQAVSKGCTRGAPWVPMGHQMGIQKVPKALKWHPGVSMGRPM